MSNRNVYEQGWQLLLKGDIAPWGELVSADVSYWTPMEQLHGRGPVKESLSAWAASWADAKVEFPEIIEHGDTLAARFHLTYRFAHPLKGPQGEIPPNNKTITVEGAQFVHYQGGKIVKFAGYLDQMSLFTQLGVIPTPAK